MRSRTDGMFDAFKSWAAGKALGQFEMPENFSIRDFAQLARKMKTEGAASAMAAANRRQNMINTVQGFTARGVYLSAAEILLLMQQAKDLLSNG